MPTHNEPETTECAERNIILGLQYLVREANGAKLSRLASLIKESIHGYLFERVKGDKDEIWH